MTQASRPAADHITNYPTSDAGPYSADQWAEMFAALFSPSDVDQGPLIQYLNELEVTDDGADIDVDTGAAMVDGHFFHNDAAVAFTIPHPGGNPRIDRVVVLVNNTNALVTVSDAGYTLDFPDDLTDYNGTASVEPYTARLVIVQGTEALVPLVPNLDQNANHYMIPLYQYQISVAGAITLGTDQREFCYFASTVGTRRVWIPAITGYNIGDATEIISQTKNNNNNSIGPGVLLVDSKNCEGYGRWLYPTDILRNLTITSVYTDGNGNNIYGSTELAAGECGEDYETHNDSTIVAAEATEANADEYSCHFVLTVANPNATYSADDIIQLTGRREAANASDTVGTDMLFLGFIVEYESKS